MQNMSGKGFNIQRSIILAFVTLYTLYYIRTLSDWHFIDNVNLIFHEAGHPIFGIFGEFFGALGGSLMQVLVPIVCTIYFSMRREYFSASLLLFWVGQNFLNVSVYAGDAIRMNLPLLGGDGVTHDWNYVLSTLDILKYTPQVSAILYAVGMCILVFGFISALKYCFEES